MKILFSLLMIIFLLSSCGKDLGTDEGNEFRQVEDLAVDEVPNFAALKKYVLTPHCVQCHSWADQESTLLQRDGRVKAGDPKGSRLYTLVRDGKMPKNRPALNEDLQQLIFDYILHLQASPQQPAKPRIVFNAVKLKAIKQQILTPYCVECHDWAEKEQALVESNMIVPGKPEQSSFYVEVESDRMPAFGPVLGQEQKQLIYDFIKEMKITR